MYAFTRREGYNFLSDKAELQSMCADKSAGELQDLLLIQSLSERRKKKKSSISIS